METSIDVDVRDGILCADFNEGRLIIDTGSPVSLGPDIAIQILGSAVKLNSSFGNYAWAQIQESLPFDAVGLVGVDAFSDAILRFDLSNHILGRLNAPFTGQAVPFVMGSPIIQCQIGGDSLLCLLDTGAGLSYVHNHALTNPGNASESREDFHPLLGRFNVETLKYEIVVGDHTVTDVFGLATPDLSQLLSIAKIDAILGTSFFEKAIIEIDFQNEMVSIALNSISD